MMEVLLVISFIGIVLSIDPSRVLVSLTIDAHNNEIVYEGVRLLASFFKFGGVLTQAKLDVCVATRDSYEHPLLMEKLKLFNLTDVRTIQRVEGPDFAKSLNKMCSFMSPHLDEVDYFLYLDDDIFIARDPMPLLSYYFDSAAPKSILCGRPWDTFPNIEEFPLFINKTDSVFFNMDAGYELETIARGITYYGMCNTGMYFMPTSIVKPLTDAALRYLDKAIADPHYRDTIPFSPSYFGIDSIVLWAAQYELDTDVIIAPPALNYIASAEDLLYRFIPAIRLNNDPENGGTSTCVGDRVCEQGIEPVDDRTPALIHMSKGSYLTFALESECSVKMRAQWVTVEPSPLRDTVNRLFGGGAEGTENCRYFLSLLGDLPYDNEDSCVPIVNNV